MVKLQKHPLALQHVDGLCILSVRLCSPTIKPKVPFSDAQQVELHHLPHMLAPVARRAGALCKYIQRKGYILQQGTIGKYG